MIEASTLDLISSVGFPIVAFFLIYYQNTKVINKNTEALRELSRIIRERLR